MKKEDNDGADKKREKKRGLVNRDPGKYYEKLSMPEVKLLCGRGVRLVALEVGLDYHGVHLWCPLK